MIVIKGIDHGIKGVKPTQQLICPAMAHRAFAHAVGSVYQNGMGHAPPFHQAIHGLGQVRVCGV
jgi:hypothetical protein